jgi:hypothetical protein
MQTSEDNTQTRDDERDSALAGLAQADAARCMAIAYSATILADARADLADAISECVRVGFSRNLVAAELGWHHSTLAELLELVEKTQARAGSKA